MKIHTHEEFKGTEAEKLEKTPAWVDDMIEELDEMMDLAVQAEKFLPGGKKQQHLFEVADTLRRFLREKVESGVHEIETMDELEILIAEFLSTADEELEDESMGRTAQLMESLFMKAKSYRFAMELPKHKFKAQMKANEAAWSEVEQNAGGKRILKLRTEVSADVDDVLGNEYGDMDVSTVQERARAFLYSLPMGADEMRKAA